MRSRRQSAARGIRRPRDRDILTARLGHGDGVDDVHHDDGRHGLCHRACEKKCDPFESEGRSKLSAEGVHTFHMRGAQPCDCGSQHRMHSSPIGSSTAPGVQLLHHRPPLTEPQAQEGAETVPGPRQRVPFVPWKLTVNPGPNHSATVRAAASSPLSVFADNRQVNAEPAGVSRPRLRVRLDHRAVVLPLVKAASFRVSLCYAALSRAPAA